MKDTTQVIIVGSSRGLGAAMTEKILEKGLIVTGIARTPFNEMENFQKFLDSGRYNHIELDITSEKCIDFISSKLAEIKDQKTCVIFNSACLESDIDDNLKIKLDTAREINSVGINGLLNIIKSVESHLLQNGGVFVGISSFSAFTPPVFNLKIAYPASKAYMNMVLRCLRLNWKNRVKVVTVNLGHIGKNENLDTIKSVIPDYQTVASKIINNVFSNKIKEEVNYPWIYCLAYKYIFRFIPDNLYYYLFKTFLKIMAP